MLGECTISNNCIIGANAVVTHSIPEGAVVVGFNTIKSMKSYDT